MRYAMPYTDELRHKHKEQNGDIVEMRILDVQKSENNPEGISYSLVYVRNGKRLMGYDNFEGHKSRHHRHIKDRITPYEFIDKWKLIEDFMEDVNKIRQGVIK